MSNDSYDISNDIAEWNPYWLSLRRLFLLRYSTKFLADYGLLKTLRSLMAWYCDKNDHSPAFSKTGHTVDIIHRLGKHLVFRQQLNSFAKIVDNSRLIFLRTNIEILFRPVAFLESKKLENFPYHDRDIAKSFV